MKENNYYFDIEVKKTMTEEEANEVRLKNEEIRKLWEELIIEYQEHFRGNPAIQKETNDNKMKD